MATITSNASGSWSAGATWVGGVKPADNDAVVIAAGHSVLMDEDTSAFTGLQTVTIQGHATTPAMLYWKDGTSGYLKIRTGYNLIGTTGAVRGRLLVNSDGVWGNTGALAFTYKAIIMLEGTARIEVQYLEIVQYGTNPTNQYVRTYGTKYDFTASGSTVDTTNNTIDLGTTPPSTGTAVMITTAAGTLPTGLEENRIYYVRGVSGNTCKLAWTNDDSTIIDITGTGSGTCSLFTGHTNTGTAVMNVLDDVTADTPWVTTAGHNSVVLANAGPQLYDQQRVTLSAIAASTITLSANVDSTQYPGARIWLASRNVAIKSSCTTDVYILYASSATTPVGRIFSILGTGGSGTTFYGQGVNSGTNATVGVISGVNYGMNGVGLACITSLIIGCYIALYTGRGASVTTIAGCRYAISTSTNCSATTIQGVSSAIIVGYNCSATLAMGCETGINAGVGHSIDKIHACAYGMSSAYDSTAKEMTGCSALASYPAAAGSPLRAYFRGAYFGTTTLGFASRNGYAWLGSNPKSGFFSEDHLRVLGASYAYLPYGDVIKNTTTVRSGGASSSLEVVPLSNCSTSGYIIIFEWTELSVPASAQNKSVYIRADAAWSSYPTNTELYVEAEYISNGTTFATTTVKSTAVLSDGSTWVQFTIPEFTPAVAGHVRYRGYLKKYEASRKIYVDNQLS